MESTNVTVASLIAAAKRQTENLSVEEVIAELEDPESMLVDLREPGEIATSGAIPGSIPIPRGMLEFRADPSSIYHLDALQPARRVILHCASGGRSALAAVALTALGYTRVAHLDGGFASWQAAGRSITGGPSGPEPERSES